MKRLQKSRKLIHLVLLNLLISAILLVVIDLGITATYFQRNVVKYYGDPADKITCNSSLTGYSYCPSMVQVNFMDKRDRLLPVYNYIDDNRRAEYKDKSLKPVVTKKESIFILGDSFIQADELPITERFEHLLRKDGYEVIAYGYSSWNSWQFLRISEQLPIRSGDRVLVFSMINDYPPSYGHSTIQTLKNLEPVADEFGGAGQRKNLYDDYTAQSFLLNRVFQDLSKVLKAFSVKNGIETKSKSKFPNDYGTTCESVKDRSLLSSMIAYEYVLLSQKHSCWSNELRESVDLNISVLKKIKKSIEDRGGIAEFYLVPAGWAFSNQNTVGRMTGDYNFPYGVTISQSMLTDYVNRQGLLIHDLTDVLKPASTKDDDLYFPVDGHWTSKAHSIIYTYITSAF
jgi:hypothetical protein